jgi:hypothetical protein
MRIKVRHFLQDPAHCAVAACATAANFYNSEINYENTKELANKKVSKKVGDEGLESSQIGMLLNQLGFHKVSIVTSYLNLVDYEWQNFSRGKMIKAMKTALVEKKEKEEKSMTRLNLKWLKNYDYDNQLVISYDFGKYIRQHLNKRKPVVLSFNWTMFQKFAKAAEDGSKDPYNGSEEEHAVVANGYDEKGVFIVDSHHQYYKYKRKKYRRGFYKISWENLMTCMGQGDVILPDDYCIK